MSLPTLKYFTKYKLPTSNLQYSIVCYKVQQKKIPNCKLYARMFLLLQFPRVTALLILGLIPLNIREVIMSKIEVVFGKELLRLRKHLKINKGDLARAVGVTTQTVTSWEDQRKYPGLLHFIRVVDYFKDNYSQYGIHISQFFTERVSLQKLKNGQFLNFSEVISVLQDGLSQMQSKQNCYDGIHICSDPTFWDKYKDLTQECYHAAQKSRVRRVFILLEKEVSEPIRKVMEEQRKNGIGIRYVGKQDINNLFLLVDLCLFYNEKNASPSIRECVINQYVDIPALGMDVYTNSVFSDTPESVSHGVSLFRSLWSLSKQL